MNKTGKIIRVDIFDARSHCMWCRPCINCFQMRRTTDKMSGVPIPEEHIIYLNTHGLSTKDRGYKIITMEGLRVIKDQLYQKEILGQKFSGNSSFENVDEFLDCAVANCVSLHSFVEAHRKTFEKALSSLSGIDTAKLAKLGRKAI